MSAPSAIRALQSANVEHFSPSRLTATIWAAMSAELFDPAASAARAIRIAQSYDWAEKIVDTSGANSAKAPGKNAAPVEGAAAGCVPFIPEAMLGLASSISAPSSPVAIPSVMYSWISCGPAPCSIMA